MTPSVQFPRPSFNEMYLTVRKRGNMCFESFSISNYSIRFNIMKELLIET